MLGGLYAALLLLGMPVPALRPQSDEVHGPVMVFGAIGTLAVLAGRKAPVSVSRPTVVAARAELL